MPEPGREPGKAQKKHRKVLRAEKKPCGKDQKDLILLKGKKIDRGWAVFVG